VDLQIKIDDSRMQEILARSIERCQNKKQALRSVGAIVREAIRTNFRAGGRPEKWKPSKRGTADSVPGLRIGTLRDTGRLMNSFTVRADNQRVTVGTNVVYAATHQYGAKKFSFGTVVAQVGAHQRISKKGRKYWVLPHTRKVRLPWGDIPARPFMHISSDDILDIEEIMAVHIMGEQHAKISRNN